MTSKTPTIGRATKLLPAFDLGEFLVVFYGVEGGMSPARQMPRMRILADRTDHHAVDPALLALRTLLSDPQGYPKQFEHQSHDLSEMSGTVLVGKDAADNTRQISPALRSWRSSSAAVAGTVVSAEPSGCIAAQSSCSTRTK